MRLADLNFRHLLYFHLVVVHGSVSGAARAAGVSQPTVSAQLGRLEQQLGGPLLARAGRGVAPTELGVLVARYAEDIFRTGRELVAAVQDPLAALGPVLHVGLADVVPSLLAQRLLAPVLADGTHRVVVRSGHPTELLADLAVHRLDVVLSDAPTHEPVHHVRAFNHLLGTSPVALLAPPALAHALHGPLPRGLHGAPVVLPTSNTVLRRSIDHWLDHHDVAPHVAAEVEDPELMLSLAESGAGAVPVPTAIAAEVCTRFALVEVDRTDDLEARVYAITTERRIRHPGVATISRASRRAVFDPEASSPDEPHTPAPSEP